MKKYSFIIYTGLLSLLLTSCIKEDIKTYQGASNAEIDATVLNSVAAGLTYPVITRIPFGGRPIVNASDSTLRRLNNTTVRVRINLVGPQSAKDETVGFTVFTAPPIATIAIAVTMTGQTPSAPAGTLAVQAAVPNVHFAIASPGTITIPANSSFGYVDVIILNAGATAGQGRFVGIELNDAGSIKSNPNYSKLGLVIDQR